MGLLKFEDVAIAATEKFELLNGFKAPPPKKEVDSEEQVLANMIRDFAGCAEEEARAVFMAMISYCKGKKVALPASKVKEKGPQKGVVTFVKHCVIWLTENPNGHNYPISTPEKKTLILVTTVKQDGGSQEVRGRIASGAEGNWLPTGPKSAIHPATKEEILAFCEKATKLRTLVEGV